MSLQKPLKFREYNVIRKNWRRAKLRIALCYPNIYKAGMTGLTVQQLYFLFNLDEEVLCERCFLTKPPRTLESAADLRSFDVLAFTLQYEEDYINMVKMLIDAGINPLSDKRSEDDPLIIAGGQAISANPLPISRIVDCIFIGELEPRLYEVIDALKNSKSKRIKLRNLYDVDCMFFIGKSSVCRSTAKDLNSTPHILAQLTPGEKEAVLEPIFANAFYLELSRSCNRKCNFCLLAWTNGPLRYRSLSNVREILDEGLRRSLAKRVVLIGAGVFDVPWLKDVCKEILARGLDLSIPSLRPDVIDFELLNLMRDGNQRTLTLGVESFSDEVKKFLGKPYKSEALEEVLKMAIDMGFSELKLYLITYAFKEEIREAQYFMSSVSNILSKSPLNIYISINPLIPKPNTPFQWLSYPNPNVIKEIYREYAKALKHPKTRLSFLNPHRAVFQALLSLSCEDISSILIDLACKSRITWSYATKRLLRKYRSIDEEPPWNIIDFGIDKGILRSRYYEAKRYIERQTSSL